MGLKFVNLHGHTGASLYDGLGSPEEHAEWLLKNAGEDSGAFAITEHGNMNSVGAIAAAQKKFKDGVKFIFGLEAYYIPSIKNWEVAKAKKKEEAEKEKLLKKIKKKEVDEEIADLVIEDVKDSRSKYYDEVKRRHHLVLCAYNQEGLSNLYRLVSRSYRQGFYMKPRIDMDMIKDCSAGLIASTACIAGVPSWCSHYYDENDPDRLAKVMNLYDKELFPLMEMFGKDRFFLELQFNKLKEQQTTNLDLIEYSKRTGYNLIVTADSHYCNPEYFKDRELYRLLGHQMLGKETDMTILDQKIDDLDATLYLKNGDQLFDEYKKTFHSYFQDEQLIKDAIERTYSIGHDLIETVKPDATLKLPKTFKVTSKIQTPFDKIKDICLSELKRRNLTSKEYLERAAYELNVIKKLGVEEYLLALREMLTVIRQEILTGTGRGSGAGSLVCYLLDITYVDPVKGKLLFERFLSPSRAELPDIDTDTENKEQAFELIKQRFGTDNVLAVSNYNALKLKSLVKDISKLHNVPFEEVNVCTKALEDESRDALLEEVGNDQKLLEYTHENVKRHSKSYQKFLEKYPKVEEHIENLYKEIKSIGRHAGGILVVPDAEANLPVIRIRGVDQSPITEGITAQHLKYFGLVKFDMLALATLRIIRRCIEIILKGEKKSTNIKSVWEFYNNNLHPDVINPADPKVFEKVYHAGKFPSIFQFAEQKVQSFCVKARPNSVGDISAITALWRPGPLNAKADQRYLYFNEKNLKREHPIIQEVLGETRGLLLYQEQFMILAHRLAGFTLEESDKLRKLLVKPSHELGEEMKKQRIEYRTKFIDGCIATGISPERATKLWDEEIIGFISYGFNKSHSLVYAYNSYQCAWLYTYYEEAWIKAALECDPNPEEAIGTVRKIGYKVGKIDVNFSVQSEWSVENKNCFPPLTSIKGVGDAAANELVMGRPVGGFKSWDDLCFKEGNWRWSKFNKTSFDRLLKMGAFDSLDCVGKDKMFKNYKHLYNILIENWDTIRNKKTTFQALAGMTDWKDWSTSEKVVMQKELTGYYDKALLLSEFQETLVEFGIKAIDDCTDERKKPSVWALIEKVEEKVSSSKKPFISVTCSGNSEKQYYFRAWNTKKDELWQEGNIVIFSLDYSDDWKYTLSRDSKPLRVTK